MPLKTLGKPPYLLPDEVENDDVLEIIEKPYIVPAEKTKWGKERGKAVVKIIRNGVIRTWTLNNTTWDRLIQDFGEDPGSWLYKKVQVKKEVRNISVVDKEVLFGKPYREPQQKLATDLKPQASTVEDVLTKEFDKLTPEQRNRVLETLLKKETM